MGDHPPITPVRAATEGQLGDAYRLYDTWLLGWYEKISVHMRVSLLGLEAVCCKIGFGWGLVVCLLMLVLSQSCFCWPWPTQSERLLQWGHDHSAFFSNGQRRLQVHAYTSSFQHQQWRLFHFWPQSHRSWLYGHPAKWWDGGCGHSRLCEGWSSWIEEGVHGKSQNSCSSLPLWIWLAISDGEAWYRYGCFNGNAY